MADIMIYIPIKQKFNYMNISELKASEYNAFYGTYISKVSKETTLIEGFLNGEILVVDFFKSIPEEKLEYRYNSDKWSVKEVFQHIIDTERVFMYRCFTVSRHDKTPLPGFEQDDYINPSNANKKSLDELIEEYQATRKSFILLLKSLSTQDLNFIGNVNGGPLSAKAAAFITLGHEIHHVSIIQDRYLD